MRMSVNAAVLFAVAAAGAYQAFGCSLVGHCGKRDVLRDEEKRVATQTVCTAFRSGGPVDCKAVCGDGFTECGTSSYMSLLFSADAGTCPDDPLSEDGTTRVECREVEYEEPTSNDCPTDGRRPANLLAPLRLEDTTAIGAYFASSAHLESAAVLAFEHMIEELEAHGAPPELVEGARRAREEEIRHARVVGDLARRFGSIPAEACMDPTPVRALVDIAIENEIEGVVRETLGAALATWRSMHAVDGAVRTEMESIAREERSHADLSWRLGEWIRPRLDEYERARVDDARRAAIEELHYAFRHDPAEDVVEIAGMPRARDVQVLLSHLEETLWAPIAEAA